jgi:hypothetical protein
MGRTRAETAGLAVIRVRRRRLGRIRFYALDGTLCVQIEADSEEEARYLCRELRFDFIGLCRK